MKRLKKEGYGVTKADIVQEIHERVGIPKQEATRLTELVFDLMKESLEKGEKVKLHGFGNFVVRAKSARRGRNPQTGDEITITPRKVLTFKSSPLLKKALNSE
jgi:integration host factor subunit alpha